MTLKPNSLNEVFITISATQESDFPLSISFMQGSTVMGKMHYNVSLAIAKTMQREKPNLLTNYADLQVVNRTYPASAELLRWYTSQANVALTAPLMIPTEVGRWAQYYICKNGLKLSRNGSDIENYWCDSEKKMYTGTQFPNIRGAWVSTQFDNVIDQLVNVVTAYGLSLDSKFADFAKPRLVKLASLYPTLPLHNKIGTIDEYCGRFYDQPLNEAISFYKLAYIYDMIYPVMSESERALVEGNLFELFKLPMKNSSENGQTFHNAALAAVGVVMENHELVQAVSLGFVYQVQFAMMDDGNWNENSIGYHIYAMEAFVMHAEVLLKYGLNLYNRAVPCIAASVSCSKTLELMFSVPLNIALPDTSFPALNDGSIGNLKGSWLYEIAHIRYPSNLNYDYVISLSSTRAKHLLSVIAGMRTFASNVNAPATKQSVLLPDMGFGILKNPSRVDYLGMDFGATGGSHGHADKLSVVLFAANRYIVQDLMTIGYALSVHYDYIKQAQSHNTILIDQKSQKIVDGSLEFMSSHVLSGISNEIYPGVSARRTLVTLHGAAPLYMDVVFTYSTSQPPKPVMYPVSWIMHSLGNFTVDSNIAAGTSASYFNGTSLAKGQALMGSEKAYTYLNNIVYYNATGPFPTGRTYSYNWQYSAKEGFRIYSAKLNSMFLADAPSFRNIPDNRMVMEQALLHGNPALSFTPMVHVWNAYNKAQDQDVLSVNTVNSCIATASILHLSDPTITDSQSFPCMDGILRSTTTIRTKSSSSPIIVQAIYSATSPFSYLGIALNYKNQFVQTHGIVRNLVRTSNLIVQSSQSLVITISNVTSLSAQRTTASIELKQDLSSINANNAMTHADIVVGCITFVPTNVTALLVNNIAVETKEHASSRLNSVEYKATALVRIPVSRFNSNLQLTITCQDSSTTRVDVLSLNKKHAQRKLVQRSHKKQQTNIKLRQANKKMQKHVRRLQQQLKRCKKLMNKQIRKGKRSTYWYEY